MDAFAMEPHDTKYLEFFDQTEYLQKDYGEISDADTIKECIKLPNGEYLEHSEFSGKYEIRDGKVYERLWGPFKQSKRTKKAKRMIVLENYPLKKIYSTFKSYARDRAEFDAASQRYGYYENPNGVFDDYKIGGYWAKSILVKDDCKEFSIGYMEEQCSSNGEMDGFKWVCAARKRDIETKYMNSLRKQALIEWFKELQTCFNAGKTTDGSYIITEDGIYLFGDKVYRKGETLEEFLLHSGYRETDLCPFMPVGIVDKGKFVSRYEIKNNIEDSITAENKWLDYLENFWNEMDDNTVIVGVDIHDYEN